jgi:DNA-directed RNA polymerase subunit omega
MLYPSLASLLDQVNSRYLLVNIIARRARELSMEANDNNYDPNEKTVSRAIGEIASGELRITVPDDL